ncbi:4'-phosphopantetheinyl transferase superfamily protein [Orbaceae bacterium ac157xtp]
MSNNHVYLKIASLNELSLEIMLKSPLLDESLFTQTQDFSKHRQKQFIAGRFLLANLLHDHFQQPQLPPIIIANNSRPCFNNPNYPDFNISHSGEFIAVAVATQGKIGLDVEVNRPRKNYLNIARTFFSQNENNWLTTQKDPLSAFWQLWTLRESAVKLYSKGVWQIKQITIDMPTMAIEAPFGEDFYPIYRLVGDLHVSICCNQQIIKWGVDHD